MLYQELLNNNNMRLEILLSTLKKMEIHMKDLEKMFANK